MRTGHPFRPPSCKCRSRCEGATSRLKHCNGGGVHIDCGGAAKSNTAGAWPAKCRAVRRRLRVRELFSSTSFDHEFDATRRDALRMSATSRCDSMFVLWGEVALIDGLLRRNDSPLRPLSATQVANAMFMAIMRLRLWASACHSSTARALAMPRTLKRCKPRLRRCALVHSMLAARCL